MVIGDWLLGIGDWGTDCSRQGRKGRKAQTLIGVETRVRDEVASMGRVAWMGVMDRSILFTSHAEENLRLREIISEEVEKVIRDPRRVEAGRTGRKTLSGVCYGIESGGGGVGRIHHGDYHVQDFKI